MVKKLEFNCPAKHDNWLKLAESDYIETTFFILISLTDRRILIGNFYHQVAKNEHRSNILDYRINRCRHIGYRPFNIRLGLDQGSKFILNSHILIIDQEILTKSRRFQGNTFRVGWILLYYSNVNYLFSVVFNNARIIGTFSKHVNTSLKEM